MPKAKLIRDIVELEQQIYLAMSKHAVGIWINLDLTISQTKTLIYIANHSKTNVKKIAEAFGVTSSNLTRIIDLLVKQNLVIRQENSVDRRMYELSLSEQGENTIIGLKENVVNSMSEALNQMSEDDLATLKRGLSLWMKATDFIEST